MISEKPVLWMLHKFDLSAFIKGKESKTKSINPYKKETNSWYSWNKGKNEQL